MSEGGRLKLSQKQKTLVQDRIRELAYRYRGASRDMATEIGVSKAFLSAVLNGSRQPSQRILDYLEKHR